MKNYTLFRWLHRILIVLIMPNISQGKNLSIKTFNFTLTTKILHSISLSDPETNPYLEKVHGGERFPIREYLKYIDSKPKPRKIHKSVKNLYSSLQKFMNTRCLIVINNFEDADINPTIEYPLILKQFDIALGRVDYIEPESNETKYEMHTIWIPKEKVSKLNGNFSTEKPNENYFTKIFYKCSIFKYLYSLWPVDKNSLNCLDGSSLNFVLSSKPWQCEVQVDLFIPDSLLHLGKYTEIFDSLYNKKLKTLPSLRQPVHIIITRKSDVQDFDWVSLAAWVTKGSFWFEESTQESSYPVNRVQVTGHVVCNAESQNILISFECNVMKWNIIFPCPECDKFVFMNEMKNNQLSFDHIYVLDKAQKSVAFPGIMGSYYARFKLAAIIGDYTEKEPSSLKYPLKVLSRFKSRDKLKMLAFAYASIYTSFMGNKTEHKSDNFRNPKYRYFTNFLQRTVIMEDIEYEDYDTPLRIKNAFGSLHFVSCGSRGIEPFPFVQFLSVFEWEVWLLILIAISLIAISSSKFYKDGNRSISFSSGIFGVYKVLVEQGNPFPPNFDTSKQIKLIMCGTLLAGLVLSNAFKSENVYKIVLPRSQISYHKIDELIDDNITLYSRIQNFDYAHIFGPPCTNQFTPFVSQYEFFVCRSPGFWLKGSVEFFSQSGMAVNVSSDSAKFRTYSIMHPKLFDAVSAPIAYLDDLVRVGIINFKVARMIQNGNALIDRFHKIQDDLIKNDLLNCSKTAWALPNYLAQILYRSLKKSGKHSNVGNNAYTSTELVFYYSNVYVPSVILGTITLIPNTGLLEWWPKFINRSDLVLGNEINNPKKPNMSGNILVIFVFLSGGLSLSLMCIVFEFWESILDYTIVLFKHCYSKLRNLGKRKCSKIEFGSSIVIAVKSYHN